MKTKKHADRTMQGWDGTLDSVKYKAHNTTIVIETPRGSVEKYGYSPELRAFEFTKLLPLGMVMPFDFGFVPGTKAEDGDPLDAIVLSEFQSFPGCVVNCRIIGIMLAKQSAGEPKTPDHRRLVRNDRLLAVPLE